MSTDGPRTRRIDLILDDLDYDAIQEEFTRRQVGCAWMGVGTILPDGDSNFAGAMVAEMVRELRQLREINDRLTEEGR